MIDIHLINMALAGVGMAAGAAIALAALVIAIAVIRHHRTTPSGTTGRLAATTRVQAPPASAADRAAEPVLPRPTTRAAALR
jgi:hypothetical protein